jgi:hypothetical protein
MVTFKSFRKTFNSTFGLPPPPVDIALARGLCVDALVDVPIAAKCALLERLPHLRRAGDWQDMRCSLFDVLSRCHGEAIARNRMVSIDGLLE